ncbi:MAG: DUF1850 domain-containing protein [Oscillospiraceae bacterium]|nr:DUF1850 domain-containing protein [Oscillospiraceae bacterium]
MKGDYGYHLVLHDVERGGVFAAYPMEEGDSFSVEFIHSVNKSPVVDVYRIFEGEIFVEETIYYHFGAGVQTELNEGETLTYGEDGSMIVGNIHQNREGMVYRVGTVSDHILTIGQTQISLRDLCGKNAAVRFNYEFRLF